MTDLIQIRQITLHKLLNEVDHVIALCQWVKEVLLRNGLDETKVTVSRQGLDDSALLNPEPNQRAGPVRAAFLGRLEPEKGVDIVIRALKLDPLLAVHLDIFGVVQGESGEAHKRELQVIAGRDPRINFLPPMRATEVVERLRGYDLVTVPSQGLETGPRVVLEAFSAGIPVIGSNLGGIAELVEHNVNGLLVAPQSVDGWTESLRNVCNDASLLPRLRAGIRRPRTSAEVARDIEAVYRKVNLSTQVAI